MLLLLSCRPSPSPCLPLRRLLRCCCTSSSVSAPSPIAPYHQSFARRMALAGIHPEHRIAVGVSGGPDSMALCVLVAAWKKAVDGEPGRKSGEDGSVGPGFVDGLLGVVVDHGLRPESAEEAQVVRDRVHGMGVLCEIAKCEWPNGRPKLGHLQEAAREIRYQKLLDICIKQRIGVLLIAHHSDDQAELFVLRLSRNSGVLGLAGTFLSELQRLIYACQLTRAHVDNTCSLVVKKSVTITEYGYIVIDLEKLDPQNVDDLCLSRYLACVLQFVSQRHRPIRGRSAQLFMDYIRNTPCKGALTVAGCYLCAFPGSKGAKILVCCSVDLMESFSAEMSYKCSYEEQPPPVPEIEQIVLEAHSYSNQFLQCTNIPFVNYRSSSDVLDRAKDLNIIGDSTLEKLTYLQTEELQKFTTTKHRHEDQYLEKTSFRDSKVLCLWPGETCHFLSRFLITWNALKVLANGICSHDSKKSLCQHCVVNEDGSLTVRRMHDTDWLLLAEVSKIHSVEQNQNVSKVLSKKLDDDELLNHYRYLQLSATKAIEILRSIPASARRTLPVLTNSQGDILSIPSIGFRCCPSLSIKAVFHPRVPLGGGYVSYL
ncbi:uncharacterized protein LOC100842962 isoform X3 [Brachypodium distachyon]|uniref:uncharacterized protein LOC100842962 isoform X3 n=1 Tax=Brachypodium distachyon TaxID=15368 RepID=UPI0005300A45|nr:uncharacterized protein LOC100842962 isoform X3 [Brachypodium distachyon]|eukprot:XP_010234123.1 uncharacterized protein LOC100842962 isoform X3 [Brachypodium distachyon]